MTTARALLLAWFALTSGACARRVITGQVIDRNTSPVSRAAITVAPGDVSILTDQDGRFTIDYIYTPDGARRTPLRPNRDYTLQVYKPGYNVQTVDVRYVRGTLELSPIDLVEDTIEVRDDELALDVGLYGNPTQSAGANYEGQ